MNYITIPLNNSFKKQEFSCGKDMLDNYLHNQAGQDMKRKLSVVFVMPDQELIKGYYTLSNSSIPRHLVPDDILKKLPPAYYQLPATLMGRLAVDLRFQGNGLGELLLLDALRRSLAATHSIMGSMAVIVDPLDDDAKKFYTKFHFIEIIDSEKMFIPMNIIEKLFN